MSVALEGRRHGSLADSQLTGGRWSGGLPGVGAQTSVPHRVHQDVGQPGKVLPPCDAEAFSWGGRGHRRGAVDAGGGEAGEEAGAGREGPRVHPLPGLGGTGPEAARGERREGAAPGPPCHCLWGRSEQLRSAPWPGGCLKQQLPLWAPVSRWIRPASLLKLASEDQLHPVVVSSDLGTGRV